MKATLGIIVVLVVGFIGFTMFSGSDNSTEQMVDADTTARMDTSTDNYDDTTSKETGERTVVAEGTYAVQSEESIVTWAGQKPLIDGYINSGSIAVTDGFITVGDNEASGSFTIDMNTLSVSETPSKPGQESTLESHLKGERWFGVEAYPEATFEITDVTPRTDSDTTYIYDITGDLTMKGVTDSLTFPATIYQDKDGMVHAAADFEFDRTVWGITAGSGSFFDNLADNVVDDMVALSFELVAEAQ